MIIISIKRRKSLASRAKAFRDFIISSKTTTVTSFLINSITSRSVASNIAYEVKRLEDQRIFDVINDDNFIIITRFFSGIS